MKKVILLLILVEAIIGCENSTAPNSPQGEWSLVGNAPRGYYNAIYFVDRNNGWVVGDSGRILSTSDGGSSWNVRESGISSYLKCVTFVNLSRGWIGSRNNSIGLTTNGGLSWVWQHPPGNSQRLFTAISFVNENVGWIVDNYGGILHTEDGGSTWNQIGALSRGIRSVQFLDSLEGWATAVNRIVLHTTNGGKDWSITNLDTLQYGRQVVVVFEGIRFVNRLQGWIGTTSVFGDTDIHPTPIVTTSDGGNTWKLQQTPENDFVNSFVFTNSNMGWAASGSGILYTNNGGDKWTYQLKLPGALFVDICLVDQCCSWALTFAGGIYRYDIQ